ncbi:hypothetical protein [Xanthomonas arboricola]|uniref:hypothetical protein n=1 Tax=Xanthomonas arboricola TaxID=56448 RepID=UPI0011AEE97F|nr:hypothetical protein [Xanthomonas arboricola]
MTTDRCADYGRAGRRWHRVAWGRYLTRTCDTGSGYRRQGARRKAQGARREMLDGERLAWLVTGTACPGSSAVRVLRDDRRFARIAEAGRPASPRLGVRPSCTVSVMGSEHA